MVRTVRPLLLAALAAALLAGCSTTWMSGGAPAKGFGDCATDPDTALCILRILGQRDGGIDVLYDPAFWGREDLLAEAGIRPATARAAAWSAGRLGQYNEDRLVYGHAAWLAARADRRGVAPMKALDPVRALDTTDCYSCEEDGYRLIAGLFDDGSVLRHTPSPALRRAAMWSLEKEAVSFYSAEFRLPQLAGLYERAGDLAGLDRLQALDKRKTPVAVSQHLMWRGKLMEAIQAISAPGITDNGLITQRLEILGRADRAGRSDVVMAVLQAMVDDCVANGGRCFLVEQFSMTLKRHKDPAALARMADRLEPLPTATAQRLAALMRREIGQTERARAIARPWLARLPGLSTIGNDRDAVDIMLIEQGFLDDIHVAGIPLSFRMTETYLADGGDLSRLQDIAAWLPPDRRAYFYSRCLEWNMLDTARFNRCMERYATLAPADAATQYLRSATFINHRDPAEAEARIRKALALYASTPASEFDAREMRSSAATWMRRAVVILLRDRA